MQSLKVAICPGSFDPVTLGHMDIINRARRIFDHVIVAVMLNPAKNTMFTVEERIELLRKCPVDMADVEVVDSDSPRPGGFRQRNEFAYRRCRHQLGAL